MNWSVMGLIFVENLELLEGNWFIAFIMAFSEKPDSTYIC